MKLIIQVFEIISGNIIKGWDTYFLGKQKNFTSIFKKPKINP